MLDIKDQITLMTKRLLEASFNQTPKTIDVFVNDYCLLIHIESFIGPVMMELVNQQDNDALRSIRELVIDHLFPRVTDYIAEKTGIVFGTCYFDWDDANFSGMLTGLVDTNAYRSDSSTYTEMDEVHSRISDVTHEVEKYPTAVYSYWPKPDTLIIIREGLLLNIEKEFVKHGAGDILRKVKRSLEKTAIIQDAELPALFGRDVKGIYLDWVFDKDKSTLLYIFEKEEPANH